MPMINADDGCPIHVEVSGSDSAPALMLSNSLGTTHEMWAHQMPALEKQFRVLRYDVRGHGNTAISDKPFGVADLSDDLLEGVPQPRWCLGHARDPISTR